MKILHTLVILLFVLERRKAAVLKDNNLFSLLNDIYGSDDEFKPDLTCFTCPESSDNDRCNTRAIDEKCSDSNEINKQLIGNTKKFSGCMTIHRFDSRTKKTFSVEKKCVSECNEKMVGCSISDNQTKTCSYCCSKNYCNVKSVFTMEQAFNLTDGALLNSAHFATSNRIECLIVVLGFFLIFNILL